MRLSEDMVWQGGHTGNPSFGDTFLSLVGFPVSAPGFDETTFDLWL